MIKRKEQWIVFGKQNKRHIFFYEEKVLDLSNFMNQHPGGKKALGNYVFKDITDIIFSVYPHKRQTTLAKLNKYVTGKIPATDAKNPKRERSLTPPKEKEKKKVCFAKKGASEASQTEIGKDEAHRSKSSKENKVDDSSKGKHQSSERKERGKSKSKSKEKGSAKQKKSEESESLTFFKNLSDDLDQQKPIFKVPILCVKRMDQLV